jgi:hypothetical protein
MANRPYLQGIYNWAEGNISYLSNPIAVVLTASGYTANTGASGDQYLSAIVSGNRVAVSGDLSSKTDSGGMLDAADLVFSSVTGSVVTQYELFWNSGTDSTSYLLWQFDTATNLPMSPNGGNITIQWPSTPPYILSLYGALADNDKRLVDRYGWRNLVRWIREWGIPVDRRSKGGLWTPVPALVQSPPSLG